MSSQDRNHQTLVKIRTALYFGSDIWDLYRPTMHKSTQKSVLDV